MRFRPLAAPLAALSLLTLAGLGAPHPAAAQTPPAAVSPGAAPAPAAPAEPGTASPAPARRRQPLPERFAEANTTHDGHLTRDQASAARWYYITKNFDAIDKARQGFVTVDDIRAYAAARRAERRAAAASSKS
jgi:hypothetical protein